MEESVPFPVEPPRTAPVTLLQKRVTNTCSHSGVKSPHVLSSAIPAVPDNSQPYTIPSTSRMNPPCGPTTPIQQFIKKTENQRPRSLNTNALSPIIRTHSRFFALAFAKDKNFKFLIALYTQFCMLT